MKQGLGVFTFQKPVGLYKVKDGFKYNCIELSTNEEYWISGCKKDGTDTLYAIQAIEIDEDVREEYWTMIRNKPSLKNKTVSN